MPVLIRIFIAAVTAMVVATVPCATGAAQAGSAPAASSTPPAAQPAATPAGWTPRPEDYPNTVTQQNLVTRWPTAPGCAPI